MTMCTFSCLFSEAAPGLGGNDRRGWDEAGEIYQGNSITETIFICQVFKSKEFKRNIFVNTWFWWLANHDCFPSLHSQAGFIEGFIVAPENCFALISMTRHPKHMVLRVTKQS